MTRYPKTAKSVRPTVAAVARSTGCKTANTLPAPRVAAAAPRRAVVRPTTKPLVEANALLAQLHFDLRFAALPAGALEVTRHA
jgi:hypothetical protein